MARSRSLPTNLFEDPDFFELSSETQIILVGLVLGADDAGRGPAHSGLLSRKLNKALPLIEQALHELEECEMLQVYQDARQSYYHLTHWQEWETLSKPTPSKYPTPPVPRSSCDPPGSSDHTQGNLGSSQNIQGNSQMPQIPQDCPGEFGETPPEDEGEEKRREGEGEGEGEETLHNVVIFPTRSADTAADGSSQDVRVGEMTSQVAVILKLQVSDALTRIVAEYLQVSSLSLLGEADAAREWIEDKRRNRNGQRMTPAFFRRWLKRELEAINARQARLTQATGTGQDSATHAAHTPYAPASRSPGSGGKTGVHRNLMNLEQEYQAAKAQGKEQNNHEITP